MFSDFWYNEVVTPDLPDSRLQTCPGEKDGVGISGSVITRDSGGIMRKAVFISSGILFIFLGVLGIALPFLPTTPFFLAAAFCLARGSKRFHGRFIESKLYKRYLGDYVKSRAMTASAKAMVLTTVSVLMLTGCRLTDILYARIAMGVVLVAHWYYFLIKIKTVSADRPDPEREELLNTVGGARKHTARAFFYRGLTIICNIVIILSFSRLLQKGFADQLDILGVIIYVSSLTAAVLVRIFSIRMRVSASHRQASEAGEATELKQ